MQRAIFFKLFFASAVFPAAANAASCDAGVQHAASGPIPYHAVSGGYCEGTFSIEVGSPFQVLSFTIGTLSFDPSMKDLVVKAPLSPAGKGLAVRARGTAGTYGYQMDAVVIPPAAFTWPTSVALQPLHFRRGDFGVFGRRIDASGGETLVPVQVGGGIPQRLLLRLIAPEHLTGPVEFALAVSGQPLHWQQVTAGSPNKGEVLTVNLPLNAIDEPTTLRVRAQSRSQPPHTVTFARTVSR